MKINSIINEAIEFINSPIPSELSTLAMDDSVRVNEQHFISVKDKVLCIDKTWEFDEDIDDIYVVSFDLGYGTGLDEDYIPIDLITFDGLDIHKVNIADEIESLLEAVFPNEDIER